MKNAKQKLSKRNIRRLIAVSVLICTLVVLSLLKNSVTVCEFFATTFSRAWIFLFGNALGWIPISFYELFLIVAIILLVVFLVLLIKDLAKRNWQKLLSLVLVAATVVLSFLNVYTATASFAYNREELPSYIYTEYDPNQISLEDMYSIANVYVELANYAYEQTEHDQNGNVVYPYDFSEISDLLAQEYLRLDSEYFSPYTPKAKRIINKWIMSQLHISGVFFAPFGEANVNGNETGLYLPFVMAHEMAHAKGVMKEYQADLVSLYVTLTSNNPYLVYGSAVKAAMVALNLLYLYPNSTPLYKQLRAKLNPGIAQETKNYSDFYKQFTLFSDIGNFFNDIYLKLQNQGGTGSYEKPSDTENTDRLDDYGKLIIEINAFSGKQNLLIHLYRCGLV